MTVLVKTSNILLNLHVRLCWEVHEHVPLIVVLLSAQIRYLADMNGMTGQDSVKNRPDVSLKRHKLMASEEHKGDI